ncbi:MAG: branched-chain amino acid ABC transporter permease [Burkholderiaceae bacterium]
MTVSTPTVAADEALPKIRTDFVPIYLLLAIALVALPFIGSSSTWVTLTIAGLAMGMMLFVMSSGLTLVFGLMDVMNFGHGAFIAVGAYTGSIVFGRMKDWMVADSFWQNISVIGLAILVAMIITAILGWFYERLFIKPVYGNPLMQILMTTGAMIVIEQLIIVIWGPDLIPLEIPTTLQGSFILGEVAIEKYRLAAVIIGLVIFISMFLVLNRTRIGLLIRAGVENGEMVQALGYRIRRLFIGVFVSGAALAALGGVMWGLYKQQLTSGMGGQVFVSVLIVIIIGGMGSVGGCFIAALMVSLLSNYAGFLAPKISLITEILLMVVVLSWRPRGLYPVSSN